MSSSWIVFIASTSLTIVTSFPAVAQNTSTPDQSQNLVTQQFNINQDLVSRSSSRLNNRKSTRINAAKTGRTTANRAAHNSQLIGSQVSQAFNRTGVAHKKEAANNQLVSVKQQTALKALSDKTTGAKGVRAYFDASNGTPSFLELEYKPDVSTIRARGKELKTAVARRFLQENRNLLKLDNPDAEMRLKRSEADDFGMQHMIFQQQINDIPVWGSELGVHLKADNSLYLLNGRFQPTFRGLNTQASLTVAEAETAVLTALNVTFVNNMQTELMVYKPENGQAVLTYKVDINIASDRHWDYFIDAHSGRVVHVVTKVYHAGTVADSQGVDASGADQAFNSWSENGSFYMIDPTFPLNDPDNDPLKVLKPKGDTYILDAKNTDGVANIFNISSNSATTGWDPAAVSAMVNTRKVYDYFKNTHGRDGIDGKSMNFKVIIHYKNKLPNAFYNSGLMYFGDGDGVRLSQMAECLDVTAHEMGHGVINTSANLKYENQSGALNESFSDIFGALVDRDDWTLGEDCSINEGDFLRSLQDPTKRQQPAKMSDFSVEPNIPFPNGDSGGVHTNSGIPNRAAYLIAEGLTVEGLGTSIGKDKMEKIFYRALTTYLTASSQFIDARKGTIRAATDLYGSAEALAVAAGWDAVEVVDNTSQPAPTPPSTAPTPTDVVTGVDQMIYLFPADGINDGSVNEQYQLYSQIMSETNGSLVYDSDKDTRISTLTLNKSDSKLAIFTSSNGTFVLYVDNTNNIQMIGLNTAQQITSTKQITSTDDIATIAVSPDGSLVAYTTVDTDDNNIHVITVASAVVKDYPITPENFQQGSFIGLNSVKFADALAFDYSSKKIVFDAYNCVSTEDSSCADEDGGYNYWVIGTMDATSGVVQYPFPSQHPNIDLSFPSFAQNNDHVITYDYDDFSTEGTVASKVMTFDFETQKEEMVFDFGTNPEVVNGIPSFWGGDDFITIMVPTAGIGTSAKRIPVNAQWQGNASAAESVNAFAVDMPIMHRAGQRVLTGALTASSPNLNFGDVEINAQADQTVMLSNKGNNDVNITNITQSGTDFTHNGTNVIVPRDSNITITVSFKAGSAVGAKTGTLTFSSDSGATDISVSLIANSVDTSAETPAPEETPDPEETDTSGDGGGGSLNLPLLSILISMVLFRRRKNN